MRLVVHGVEVLAVPAAMGGLLSASLSLRVARGWEKVAYVGKRMLDRMPPGHTFCGKAGWSTLKWRLALRV